jgi:hypothetical protein
MLEVLLGHSTFQDRNENAGTTEHSEIGILIGYLAEHKKNVSFFGICILHLLTGENGLRALCTYGQKKKNQENLWDVYTKVSRNFEKC